MADEPTLREVVLRLESLGAEMARQLGHLADEIRELRRELVRSDVYEAHRQADRAEVDVVRSQVQQISEERRQMRMMVVTALLGAGLSIAAQVITSLAGG